MSSISLSSVVATEPMAAPRPQLSSHSEYGWHVKPEFNTTVEAVLFGERKVKIYSKSPENYDAMFRAAVARAPEREAVVCGGRRLSYRDLDRLVDEIAAGLFVRGLSPGGRVAVMLDNRLEYLASILAVVRAGGIAVPLGTRLGSDDVAHIVNDASPVFAITNMACRDRFPIKSSVQTLFIVDADGDGDRSAAFWGVPIKGGSRLVNLDASAPMMIVYTSGTTGKPKGVVLTHINFIHTCLHYIYALSIEDGPRGLLVVPGTHIAGFGPVMSVMLASAGTIVMMREFKAPQVLETLERERIDFAVMVPAMYQLCLMAPGIEDHDLERWQYGVYGGAITPPAVIDRVSKKLPTLKMINAYGATETCAVCTIIPPELTAQAPSSVGLPLECAEIKIVDADGCEVETGAPGELLVRGPNVSPGYWSNDKATQDAFEEGFWKSGDIASRDAAGLIYIHDRLKDMINRGGYKVFSAEVETSLMAHPGVADCAVVGIPDEVLGEKVFAFVQRRDPKLESATLLNFLGGKIADYKVPDFWSVGDEPIPRNQNGKLQKAILRNAALAKRAETSGQT